MRYRVQSIGCRLSVHIIGYIGSRLAQASNDVCRLAQASNDLCRGGGVRSVECFDRVRQELLGGSMDEKLREYGIG